jgi:twinkle protein
MTLLQRFEKIYLWMDNDGPGQEGCEAFAEKFGIKRCYIVQPSCNPAPKDANEALLMGLDLNTMLEESHIKEHEYVVDFKGLRSQVMNQILNPDKYMGVAAPSLPGLTSIVKGFRRGELTVVTGPTGSGKVSVGVFRRQSHDGQGLCVQPLLIRGDFFHFQDNVVEPAFPRLC